MKMTEYADLEIKWIIEKSEQDGCEHPELRYGQSIFNITYNKFPEIADKLRGTAWDCFHNDDNMAGFLDQVRTLLMGKKDPYLKYNEEVKMNKFVVVNHDDQSVEFYENEEKLSLGLEEMQENFSHNDSNEKVENCVSVYDTQTGTELTIDVEVKRTYTVRK